MQQPNDGCNGNSGVPNTNNVGNKNSTSICVAVTTGVFCLATALIPVIVSYKKKNELEDKKTKNKMEVDDHKAWLDIKKNEEKNFRCSFRGFERSNAVCRLQRRRLQSEFQGGLCPRYGGKHGQIRYDAYLRCSIIG